MKYSASSVWENKDRYGIAVIGAGHAGCEAALAAARLGVRTIMFTVSVDSIALMPCNPNIGGVTKVTCQRGGCTWRRDGKGNRPYLYSVQDAE